MTQNIINHIVYSTNVVEFVAVTGEYCNFVEKTDNFSKKEFINKSLKLLSLIYLKALMLPNIDNNYEDLNEKFVSENDWIFIKHKISVKLSSHDTFIDIIDPIGQENGEAVSVSISECFADIYQDLKNFITIYQVSSVDAINDALWECKLNFEQFWGQRALSVLSSFHSIYYNEDIEN